MIFHDSVAPDARTILDNPPTYNAAEFPPTSSPTLPSASIVLSSSEQAIHSAMLLTKSFVILCSAALATARLIRYEGIITGALLLGKDTSDPIASPLDVYLDPNNHAVAVASVTVHAARKASLEPSTEAANEDTYSGFKIMVSSFPGYEFNFVKFKDFSFIGTYDLKKHVSVCYQDFARSNRNEADEVTSALMDVVDDHLKEGKEGQGKNWIFSTVVIRQLDFTIQLEIVELNVRSPRYGHVATLEVRSFQVITPVLTARAKELAKEIPIVSIEDFIKYFRTTNSESRQNESAESCSGHKSEQIPFLMSRPHALYPRM
ncbi:hypothetical protein EC968_009942 [Mortierella alpina]|nr:hypothetical protein EC968_009942 [Mortierella alpina]